MGLLWEMFQEYQIGKQHGHSTSIEERVEALETEVQFLEELLEKVIPMVENIAGEPIV